MRAREQVRLTTSVALTLIALAGCVPDPACELDVAVAVEALSSVSCAERTDVGYVSGSPYAITVVTVDGRPVERDTANAYYVMAAAASYSGVEIRIVSGFRTLSEQERLYECGPSGCCCCNSCNLAARPGYSNHQSGHALDLNTSAPGVLAWLNAHGAAFGFRRTVPSEPWHWEWWGGGPGGGPCGVVDRDGDGSPEGIDCDDHDARRFPGRAEDCDGHENDCDGQIDEALVRVCGTDVGECSTGVEVCAGAAWGACEGAVGPVPESCNELDDDCDGSADEERVCEHEEAWLGPGLHGATLSTDVDGDGGADACVRGPTGLSCLLASERGWAEAVVGPSIEGPETGVPGTSVRMGDIDGDGLADVCVRTADRLRCWRSDGGGFAREVPGPALTPGTTSIELADVDGNGALDACTRDAAGLRCALGTGHGFERTVTLAALSDTGGFADVVHHGTLRMGDIDGDGRTDVCARDAAGMDCWRSLGDHFGERVRGPRWRDDDGWAALPRWSTVRLLDVDHDRRADLCARTPDGFQCHLSVGERFGEVVRGPALSAADGWDRPAVYTTLRMGDVDADGRADVCAREPDRVRCWLFTGHGFDRVMLGPELSDEGGWARPERFRSIRLADVDGDARADVCARDADGLRCYVGPGFGRLWTASAWSDVGGYGTAAVSNGIRLGGARRGATSRPSGLGGCAVALGARGASLPAALSLVMLTAAWLARRRNRRGTRGDMR